MSLTRYQLIKWDTSSLVGHGQTCAQFTMGHGQTW
jgi:hypothetical protein